MREIKLPIFWTNTELETFIDTLPNHFVCNSCIYTDNIRFWAPYCLESVESQCRRIYSQIPWQLVLQNYNWHNFDLLKKIGKCMFTKMRGEYVAKMHSEYFAKMFTDYQEWSADELRIVIKNMQLSDYRFNSELVNKFITKYILYFDEADIKLALKMLPNSRYLYKTLPFEYHKYYLSEIEPMNRIPQVIEEYSEEQARELMELYFERNRTVKGK